MKKLSDYKDEAAIELWADLLDPFAELITDKKVKKLLSEKDGTPLDKARAVLKAKPKEAVKILKTIDPTPVDGVNAVLRIMDFLLELLNNEDLASFFGFAAQAKEASESSGSATGNTQAQDN